MMGTIIEKIEHILTDEYSVQNYVEFIQEVFAGVKLVAPNSFRQEFTNFSSHIAGSSHIGNYTDPNGKQLIIFSVELLNKTYVETSRSTQRSYAKKLIENAGSDAALIAFYTKGDPKWRISLVCLDYEIKFENGKLKTAENMTPAKRYSYLVGKDEPCHTAIDRFRKFIEDSNNQYHPTLDELEEAFSVEAVTKEFFELYCEKYKQLLIHLEDNEDFVIEAQQHNYTAAQFAKKLMGQIVFLYFLQKKGWLGVGAWPSTLTEKEYKNAFFARGKKSRELIPIVYCPIGDGTYKILPSGLEQLSDEDEAVLAQCVKGKPWGSGPHNFMRKLFQVAEKRNANFFDDYLEPLFYNALNVNRGEQGYDPDLHCRIPFLSGGLFEPIDGYDWKHNDFAIPNEIFSNRINNNPRTGNGILDIFDRYNFTMSEDEPLEREVAIDPEMLGKVFENLLEVNDRKAKGAFYTPRKIVHYMCQECLINYLTNALNVSESDIRDFILYGDLMKDEDTVKEKRLGNGSMYISEKLYKIDDAGNIIVNKLIDMDKALQNVRIADPAVGSGAFPLGMLNEIVKARQNISAYMAITMSAYDTRLMYLIDRSPRRLKYDTIKNCIFASDIEPSAVDITQLRLWLALVIDDEINPEAQSDLDGHRNPLPLPNLESNIVCGNTLIDEFEGVKLINESDLLNTLSEETQFNLNQGRFDSILKELIEVQDEMFKCDSTEKKQALKKEISSLRNMIIMSQLYGCDEEKIQRYQNTLLMASKPYVLWQLDFAKVFKEKGGFDIVIGNPPYLGFHKVPNKDYHKEHYYSANGKYDFYVLFIEKGLNILNKKGLISYICPSYFYKRNYGKNIRHLLLSRTNIKYIADFSDYQIFESALTYTCIFGAQNGRTEDKKIKILSETLLDKDAHYIDQSDLQEPSWKLETAEENSILAKIQEKTSLKFGDITKSISQGIVTGCNDVYYVSQEVISANNLEMTYFEQAYKGKDIRHGSLIDNNMYLFYPYIVDEKGKTVPITEEELKLKSPNMYNYLLEKREQLMSRGYFAKSTKKWYELWNPRKKEHFFAKKFVFAEINMFNDFALVEKCFYTDSACGAELLPKYGDIYPYMLLYLNSDIVTYIYKKVSVPKANGYSIYKNAFLKELPVYIPENATDEIYSSMTQVEFNLKIRQMLKVTTEEDLMIKNVLESYMEG